MSDPKTLLQLAGVDPSIVSIDQAVLVLVDFQNEYLKGPVAVSGAQQAIERAALLLARAREAKSPVIHIAHKGRTGSLFDRDDRRGAIVDALEPVKGERLVEKPFPNSFTGTDLAALIEETGRKDVVMAGFQTHMCISSTARAAMELGFRVTVDADCCATRDLPDGEGGAIDAASLHKAALVGLSDRFATIARGHDW